MDNNGTIDGFRKGEKECIKPRAGDADLWIKKNWEELHELVKRGILVEVEHVKAHRTGAMLDEDCMAEARAETVKQEREEVYVALQCAASFHCLVEAWKDCEELKPQPKEKWSFVD